MKTSRGEVLKGRFRIGLDIFVRTVAVVLCLPLFAAMFYEMRKRI